MPHCIVEYSIDLERKIEITQLNHAVFNSALKSELFEEQDIKVRAIGYAHFQTGKYRSDFIHVVVKVLNGRTFEQQKNLSALVLQALDNLGVSSISLTVEIVEIEADLYAKLVK
ncbi:5-carboxymethyl-2-hydroxymuconate Delta-isomerase [Pseudoalteromonas denitrificans]|uniref:5-carboxymethyl-2-hydroxymuconate isomerase n=1 Tax=Pseudoalteromonas denitrificans DSM 6059 TaxID=1123010 RepID=A0A1I1KT88_9GAMM|nr:5-carboxymethyl-2-hydroxymuconate Delta-isomerase [Pseudoalteromonas denitrificans]SFC60660.1 5-carboxymethyl-2-hydroxymuconate isomerase [Pseudoalteromonas denitrificans DSM 6059]